MISRFGKGIRENVKWRNAIYTLGRVWDEFSTAVRTLIGRN